MISYVKGELTEIFEDVIVLENNGIGYNIRVPASVFSQLPSIGQNVKVYTYLYVKEDAMNLFGFLTRDDLKVFKLLLNVSGIGPKGALAILSTITPDNLRFAVLSEDVKTISSAPGIGAKTAKRLIIELKDKLDLEDMLYHGTDEASAIPAENLNGGVQSEAVQALVALGYGSTESLKAVKKVKLENATVEEVLKEALKHF